ncbi:RNA pseudouridylate synthase domain-containing protein 1-like [Patiria miniata]|uniref:Pseudouridine synthase RsuA/RluA-like domain-containing protein n=1 Tax=Patiria miniata TaxID=46514 RepID=A0A914AP20_PATMI|nr:RNA pseudouridylate synthase domain-containing protein 1-like [Patiria miniata]XP_038065363.1 RNA pseudouridylate synthase domain-containing protein 1-like [Patiria miniata]
MHLHCQMSRYLQRIQVNLHWLHAWLRRGVFGRHRPATMENLDILYKSSNFIVVNKHYDVKINSDDSSDKITVATQLAHRFPELVDASVAHQFRFVHRIDYSTSGALCVALNKKASADAVNKFKKRQVTKCYYALLRGHVREDFLRIDKPVYANPQEGYTHMMCTVDDSSPDHLSDDVRVLSAVTDLYVVQRGLYDGQPASKVLLKPQTGRRHQLRVHCLGLGHPIVGDYTYSYRRDVKPYRMMLHSHRLTIPAKGETVDVVAPDPFVTEVDPLWQPLDESGISQDADESPIHETVRVGANTGCHFEEQKQSR